MSQTRLAQCGIVRLKHNCNLKYENRVFILHFYYLQAAKIMTLYHSCFALPIYFSVFHLYCILFVISGLASIVNSYRII